MARIDIARLVTTGEYVIIPPDEPTPVPPAAVTVARPTKPKK